MVEILPNEGVEKSNRVIMSSKISLHAQHVPVRIVMLAITYWTEQRDT